MSEAQLVVASEAGFTSWPNLKHHIEGPSEIDRNEILIDAAFDGDSDVVAALLVPDPGATRFEEWGEEKLIELAKICNGLPVLQCMRRIFAAAQAFAAGAAQHDDMTLVVLRLA